MRKYSRACQTVGPLAEETKMLLIIALIIVALIAAALAYATTKADTFRVERRIVIQSAAEKITPLVNDFHHWSDWTPYNKDPDMLKAFSGAASGVGAIYEWEGNSQVGKGMISISESLPEKITLKLDFIRPFVAHNTAEFSFVAQSAATQVSWAMYGPQPYFGKVMSLFFNVDKMVGQDFEKGLAQLKAVAESA